MIRHSSLSLAARNEWNEALVGIPHGFAHTWESCYAMSLTSRQKTFLYCFESESVRIVCPFTERAFGSYKDIFTPYGYSGFVGNACYPDFPTHWAEFAERQNYVCSYVTMNPVLKSGSYYHPRCVSEYNTVFVLDLTLPESDLFARMSRNRRRELRDWGSVGKVLIFDRESLCKFFLRNYRPFFQHKGSTQAYSFFSYETLEHLLPLDKLLIVGAGEEGSIESVLVITMANDSAETLFHISVGNGSRFTSLLIWWGVKQLKQLGVRSFNLGGGVRGHDAIAESKRRLGAHRVALRCAKQVYRPRVYQELCRKVSADVDGRGDYFPPYHKPQHDAGAGT